MDDWSELSDNNVWPEGYSSAIFDLYMSYLVPSVHLDTTLVPQPSGACFAGMRTNDLHFNLEGYDFIEFKCNARGNATTYMMILGHGDVTYPNTTFEQSFQVCLATY